jgi:hypothetical protein
MTFIVFAQTADTEVDTAALASNAEKFFGSKVEVGAPGAVDAGGPGGSEVSLRFETREPPSSVELRVRARRVGPEDLHAARTAEARGHAAGMGALAERCRTVWEIHAPQDASPQALFTACAAAASVALGPILPPEHDTLLGVRSAMQRAGAGGGAYR